MVFPATPLPIKGQLYINGAWVDVTSRVRNDDDIVISGKGRSNEQGSHTVSTCNFTLNNRDGLFSPRNPSGTYYGQLNKNLPFRCSVTESTTFAFFPPTPGRTDADSFQLGSITTADKAVLDITGDIDLRIDMEFDDVDPDSENGTRLLASKYEYSTSNNRSWAWWMVPGGYMRFGWSALGTSSPISTGTYAQSTAPVPTSPQRIALRATLDVNNGLGGYTVTFYTSDSISGTWTVLGSPIVTTTGTTSIYSSTAVVEIFSADTTNRLFADQNPMSGRVYAFEIRNGLAGTLVAKMDATSRSPGDVSWSDGLGTPNTWTVNTPAEITNSNYRFTGEVSELPQRWDPSGRDVFVPVVASTLGRRLSQGQSPLKSPIFRNLSSYPFTTYVPLEDESQSTTAANFIPGAPSGGIVDVSFGSADDLPASVGVATISGASSRIKVLNTSGSAGTAWSLLLYMKWPSIPGSSVGTYDWFFSSGSLRKIQFNVNATGYAFNASIDDGTVVGSINSTFGTFGAPNQWIAMKLQISQSGGNIAMEAGWYPVLSPVIYGSSTSFVGTVGRPSGVVIGGSASLADTQWAHVAMINSTLDITTPTFTSSTNAYIGELAGNRFLRLLEEEELYGYLVGSPRSTEAMGAQPTDTLLNILTDCVQADGGMLDEPRHDIGLVMRTRRSLFNQPGLVLNYDSADLSGSLLPTDDDQLVRNYVTVSRPLGSSATAAKETGANNIDDPSAGTGGVGKYDTTVSKNVSSDDRLPFLASQEVFLGTWDEARYPTVQVNLERNNFLGSTTKLALAKAVAKLNLGGRLTLQDLPTWVSPDDAELLVQGYTEALRNRGWEFRWNTSPYGPYLANNLTSGSNTRYRAAANGTSVLSSGINSTANSFTIQTTAGNPAWGDSTNKPGNFPLDIYIGGERMTVGAISVKSGLSQSQTFSSVTRSVNGIVKSHSAFAPIQVADVFYAAL